MNKFKEARKAKNLTQTQVAEYIGINQNTYSYWESGRSRIDDVSLKKLARLYDRSVDYLLGNDSVFRAPEISDDVIVFPVIGEIAAGYDSMAVENWSGDTVTIPVEYLKGRRREEFFVLSVVGDSMYPLYMEGDRVLVLKQSTLNRSGEIGAVLYDDECATLKKVEYVFGEDWLELIPINPNYPPKRIENAELERCRVMGIPWLLIREMC